MKKNAFWNGEKSRYGVNHRPIDNQINGNKQCLLVFVHGVLGDCTSTWQAMPKWVLDTVDVDINVISYNYPSGLMQRCSIAQAADDLRVWLETEYKDFPHLVFVTHSAGGLVVKQMLCNALNSLKNDIEENSMDFSLSPYIWLRTRRVINISVPHKGGSSVNSFFAKWAYKVHYFLWFPILRFVRFFSQGSLDWGKNEIIPILRSHNPSLLKLEKEFLNGQRYAIDSNIPFPRIYDICANADLSVPIDTDINQRNLYIRGTHSSVKIPRSKNAPIISAVADKIAPFANQISTNIVTYSMLRIATVNHSMGIKDLIKTKVCEVTDNPDLAMPSLKYSSFGSQGEVVDNIVNLLQSSSEQPRQLVVTGAAGVGKSIVTRMIAWQLGLNYLANPEEGNPLPLLIPLQQISASNSTDSDFSWVALWEWWLQWGSVLYKEIDCDQKWLEDFFKNKPVTIILDGLDDFLHNHSNIGFSTFISMLRTALKRYTGNTNLTIIIGIRNTIHGIERLVHDNKCIFEVLRLSTAQAKQVYPNCEEWIDSIKDRQLLDFILTPLILANYEPETIANETGKSMTHYSFLHQTIHTILTRSHLVGYQFENHTSIEFDHLDYAMMLIAWLFYAKSRGEISIEVLRREALHYQKHWQLFFQDMKVKDETFYDEQLVADHEAILLGFQLVSDNSVCDALLQRSVFIPTGAGKVRFSHRQWQEFLLGQYLSLCVRTNYFSELGETAFHSRIYKTAGEAFGKRLITEKCSSHLFNVWQQSQNSYITGNVIALLSWTQISIEPKALQRLLDEILNVGQLSRLVLMAGLSYRVLVNQSHDFSHSDIKRALFPQLKKFANSAAAFRDDPVVSSLSWCYQKAFAEQLGTESPLVSWPNLDIEEQHTLKALPVICTVQNNEYILDERSKSLQLAFLVPIMETYSEHKLVIRAVHYLYYLVVAQKYGVHVVLLSQELPRILLRGGEFEKIVASFDSVPEILTLFHRCQSLYEMM